MSGYEEHSTKRGAMHAPGRCTCSIEYIDIGRSRKHENGKIRFHFCPLHGAAPEMLVALGMFLEAQDSPAPRDLLTAAAMQASAAIAKATGQVTP